MMSQLIIFDTTLRDGEQSPGASMTHDEKLLLAKQLERLGVDVIEAGFPAASMGDFEAVADIAKTDKKQYGLRLGARLSKRYRKSRGSHPPRQPGQNTHLYCHLALAYGGEAAPCARAGH